MQAATTKAGPQAETAKTEAAIERKAAAAVESPQQIPLWANDPLPIQFSLTVNTPGDPYEQEADRVAAQVMCMPARRSMIAPGDSPTDRVQRQCLSCADEDDRPPLQLMPASQQTSDLGQERPVGRSTLQRVEESSGASGALPTPVERQVKSLSGGQPLSAGLRSYFEPRFGYDFDHVRIHSDDRSAQSAEALNAQAYTMGNRIVFNHGQFAPHTQSGIRLLAHELTHVVQQNPAVGRKPSLPQPDHIAPSLASHHAADTQVQRKPFFLAPVHKPSGTLVHSEVLPLFLEDNSDLFIEAPIPGATRKDTDKNALGRADFYKAEPQRTIGIKFAEGEPAGLSGRQVKWGGGKYNHNKQSAPQGHPTSPKIRKLNEAPVNIQIGDLKPGFSAESFLGEGQIENYKAGINNTAAALRTYQVNNPTASDSKGTWTPVPTAMASLTIPTKVTYPSGTAFPLVPLALYEDAFPKVRRVLEDTSLKGRLFVYKDSVSGVWSYEWIPQAIPSATGSGLVNTVLDRLNSDVLPSITAAPASAGTVRKKEQPVDKSLVRKAASTSPVIQKADKKFDSSAWKKRHFEPWKTDAERFLADKKEVEKATVTQALVELADRSHLNIGLPTEVKERGRGLDKIRHWKRFGSLYGWLREKFDFIYVKLKGFADRVKAKMKKLAKSSAAVKFGNWIKATARVIFKIFKLVGSWVVRETVDRLLNSLREGISNNIKKLVEAATPEGVTSKIEEFEALKEHYEKIVNEKEAELEKLFFGDKLELFDKLEEFEKEAERYSTIVSLVEWGVRLLACASPPAIGCLWNLAISALQAAFAILIQTCWFTKKVYAPIISKVDLVKKFPDKLASEVVTLANGYIPVPKGFDPLFAPITINIREFQVDCGEAGDSGSSSSPEREAVLSLIEEIGPDKFNALLEVMLKRGAGPWVLLTPERVASLKDLLQDVSLADLNTLAKEPGKAAPVSLEEFLADISQYSEREKKTAKKFFQDKTKREAAKAAAAKGGATEADGASKSKEPAGGKGKGDEGTVTVLQGKNQAIKAAIGKSKPASSIVARVHDASWKHAKDRPDIIVVNIYVDGVQKYRVENVRVKGVFGSEILAVPTNILQIVYYLEDGLQINIGGIDYFWEQLVWAKQKEEAKPAEPQQDVDTP